MPNIEKATAWGIVLLMAVFTIIPSLQRWGNVDIWLTKLVFCVCMVALFFGCAKKSVFSFTVTDMVCVAWAIYTIVHVCMQTKFHCRTEFLNLLLVVCLYVSLRLLFSTVDVGEGLLVGSLVACGLYEAMLGIMQLVGIAERNSIYSMSGTFLNPGPYSAYLMLGIVGTLFLIKEKGSLKLAEMLPKPWRVKRGGLLKGIILQNGLLVVLAVMAMVLLATWSRAAILTTLAMACVVYRRYYWRYRYVVWATLALVAIVYYFVKQGSADGRIIIWHAALAKWWGTPLLGVGLGGFCNTVAEGMGILYHQGVDLSMAGVADLSYNAMLKIVVEQGLVGFSFALCALFVSLTSLRKSSKSLFCAFLSLLLFSLFSYPFALLPYKIVAVVSVAWAESKSGKKLWNVGKCKMVAVSIAALCSTVYVGRQMTETIAADEEYGRIRGRYVEAFVDDYYELAPMEMDNAEFLFDMGKTLREARRYNDSNAFLSQGTLCSADPMFYILMGNNYKDMKAYRMAESAYQKAFAIMPNRLYPLYQLMLLYECEGDGAKKTSVAQRIVTMKPKIQSSATMEMKNNALKVLGRI